jgi:predicted RNase H-like HicB family nuclease
MNEHHINVFYSRQDKAWIADIPDFDMCSAFGDTPQEALAEVLIAKAAIIETMREKGLPIPEPKYHPEIYNERTG